MTKTLATTRAERSATPPPCQAAILAVRGTCLSHPSHKPTGRCRTRADNLDARQALT